MDYGHEEVELKFGRDPRIFNIVSDVSSEVVPVLLLHCHSAFCISVDSRQTMQIDIMKRITLIGSEI